MARRVSKHQRPFRPLSSGSLAGAAQKADGRWIVRTVSATAAQKDYTCPFCGRGVMVGTAHIVAWRDEPGFGQQRAVDGRRHFHTACFNRMP
ncbi:hypothetical protein ACQB6R_06370 [Propionibacteriaceae bacterium G1746]|uniref:hypothetical protein n=1 Tax=Aestuariimicrobium sp. G57 TaxID=3418485 RepID=UPI003C28AEE0